MGSKTDSALAGTSPRVATALRALEMEQRSLRGEVVIQMLWDVEKYFDSIDIEVLVERAVRHGFPKEILIMGLQIHRAPRLIKVAGTYADVIVEMGRSMIAGCTLSTSLSRAYLKDVVEEVPIETGHSIAEHVDDVQQNIHARSSVGAAILAMRQGSCFGQAMIDSGLTPSTKSVVISNTPGLAARVARNLSTKGLPLKAEQISEDLGVSTRGGNVRVVASMNKRIAKSAKRARRIGILARRAPQASAMYRTGVCPQQNYDSAILGAGPTQIQAMRKTAVIAIKSAGCQPCVTTFIRWRLNNQVDPALREPVAQVRTWIEM